MASADAVSPSSARRSLRHLLFNPPSPSCPRPHPAADWNPLIAPPPPQPPLPPPSPRKKQGLAAKAFRGLGCASESASQAFAPAAAAVRTSADWRGKRPRRRREKKKGERKNQAIGDVWCAPGMPFAAEASVDCVVAHQPMVARGRPDAAERIHREVVYL
ncbi:hypothetical protein BHE74_00041085 [Ensete ventricosum]|nr:hypothetical protein BHE74_00041085 [Ensete ventricosum]